MTMTVKSEILRNGADHPWLDLVVRERRMIAEGVVRLTLNLPGGGELPPWEPGAHIELQLGEDIARQYSLCGDPGDRTSWQIAVLLDPASRGGSTRVHQQLMVGSRITCSVPRNHFRMDSARSYVFVAGGIGITPILPMLTVATREGANWDLLYGGRTRSSMAFLDELGAYGDRVQVQPQDEMGLLDLDALLGSLETGTLVYCCGPEPLLDAVAAACSALDEDCLRVERFAAASTFDRGRTTGEFTIRVELRRSGVVVDVPQDRSVLDVINEAGARVMSSCEDGICGTCEVVVLDGVPDHRDSVLSAQERRAGNCILPCVSRAETDYLVLDV